METILTTLYYKDSELNIVSEDPAGVIRVGFSTDTLSLFISDGTRWYKYEFEEV